MFSTLAGQVPSVVGDLEVPLGELLLHHHGAAALAGAVGQDLLVGEHGLVDRVPVDPAVLAVGQALLVQLQEQPLVPLVVLGVAGVQFAGPVEGGRVELHALLLLRDVVVGPAARVDAALDGGVLGGKAERVPADRVQHVEALLAPVARHDVTEGVDLGVTHVQVAGRVREHVEHILARPFVIGVAGAERLELFPDGRPLRLDRGEVVAVFVLWTGGPAVVLVYHVTLIHNGEVAFTTNGFCPVAPPKLLGY
jgi:hypothetical protein